jgi:capsular polysaccharide biosynthesis protein
MAPISRPDSFELADYLGVLRRRWWIAAVLVIVGVGVSLAYLKLAPKSYEASVLIQVNGLPNNANAVGGRTDGNVDMDNEAQIAQSVTVAALAARQFPAGVSPPDLAKVISVSVPANSTFLQIKCDEPTPFRAAQCANAFGRAYLTNRRSTVVNGISSELSNDTQRIAVLDTRIARLKNQLGNLPPNSEAHIRAQLNLTAAQQLLNSTTADSTKLVPFVANLSLPNNTTVGLIATPATAPTSPASPRALLLLPSGVLAGLLLGLLAAFFTDFRDRRIHAARDVERFLDLPVLVNMSSGKSRVEPTLALPRSRAGQAFTELGQYVAASLGEGSHVVFVAGTSVGPGCSVLAANLAATLARTRSEVVLVCADPHGTVTPQLLGVSDGRGLAEVLSGSATASDVARRPPDEARLRVITPGIDTSGVLVHLQYEASRRLLGELCRDARYVIVEVQSVGEDSDAFALAEFADAAIMAIETSLTTRSGAADCLLRLDRLRTSVLGAVVLPAPSKGRRPAAAPVSRPAPVPLPSHAPAGRTAASRTAASPPWSGDDRRRQSAAPGGRAEAAGSRSESKSRPDAKSRPESTSRSDAKSRPESKSRPGSPTGSGSPPGPGSQPGSGSPPNGAAGSSPRRADPTAARPLTETRPLPRVPAAEPAKKLNDPIDFPPSADQIAGG